MSDPANWRVGDIFVIVENKNDDHEFIEGTIVRFTGFNDGGDGYLGTFEYQDGRDYWFCKKESVKWHSRPPQ